MLFNSIDFAIFLPLVFLLYWFVFGKSIRIQNLFLLLASYFFYGWWDWRFLSLIIFSSFLDYFIGRVLGKTDNVNNRKKLLWLSIIFNLGILGFFKYFNFFVASFISSFSFLGFRMDNTLVLSIVLPVGISFYTFQTLSYTIDVYKRKLTPTGDIVAFFSFVTFFPQLVAGPIERAKNLLPQFYKRRGFDYNKAVDGIRQILWGTFKKVVIADNCATYANEIFNNSSEYSGSTLLVGALFFTFQIYGDFSGYSDIAIGVSRLFGFDLMKNFAFPYFSRDIAEFWRRWHISLTTWFRDYLYIPLGGSKGGTWMKIRNTFIIFIVSGFWHGANWTFLVWGFINACYFLPLMLLKTNRKNMEIVASDKVLPSGKELLQILTTFFLTVFAWIFFRSASVGDAFRFINDIFSKSFFISPNIFSLELVLLIVVFLLIEWIQRFKEHGFQLDDSILSRNKFLRWSTYTIILFVIYFFAGSQQEFIYFQF